MADTKITALTAITTVDPAADVLPIVDVSDTSMAASGTTKKITSNQILGAGGTATLASATITGDLTVDTSTLKVDSALNRVGVGTASPAFTLDVQATVAGAVYGSVANNDTGGSGSARFRVFNSGDVSDGFAIINNYGAAGQVNLLNYKASSLALWTNSVERFTISSTGVATWSNVGGVAGTAMTLNSTGLGVGASPSQKLDIIGSLATRAATTGANQDVVSIRALNSDASAYANALYYANSQKWHYNGASLGMTLDASGNLLVATTNASFGTANGFRTGDTGGRLELGSASSTNANIGFDMYSTGAAAYRFYVGWGGTVFATNTTISAISDARLKENVQDIDVGLGAILALKPRKFDWKAGKGKDIKGDRGFIAQEFEQVFPNLIDEWKDAAPEGEAPYKSVRQDLIPVLVKAIQELAAEVNALKNA